MGIAVSAQERAKEVAEFHSRAIEEELQRLLDLGYSRDEISIQYVQGEHMKTHICLRGVPLSTFEAGYRTVQSGPAIVVEGYPSSSRA